MQKWDPEQYARHARFVSDLGSPVVDLLDPQPGERILDLGCGDGVLTETLIAAGCQVVAIDSSPEQVRAARARGLDARIVDGTALPFNAEFDAVFSNAVLHWIKDADAALTSVVQALKPGGRFVAELGGAGCVASIREAFTIALHRYGVDATTLDPWYFPTAKEYRSRLEAHGLTVESLNLFPRPTPLPSDVMSWLGIFAQPFFSGVAKSARPRLAADVRELLKPRLLNTEGTWVVDYVRLRIAAVKRTPSGVT